VAPKCGSRAKSDHRDRRRTGYPATLNGSAGEYHENAIREPFQPTEVFAIYEVVGPIEVAAAKERMAAGGKGWKISTPSDGGKTRDKIGKFAGVSGVQLQKIIAVTAAREQPDKFGDLPAIIGPLEIAAAKERQAAGLKRGAEAPAREGKLPARERARQDRKVSREPPALYRSLSGISTELRSARFGVSSTHEH